MTNRGHHDDFVLREVFNTKIENIEDDIKEIKQSINESNKFNTEVILELKENTGILTTLMVQYEKRMDRLDEIADKRSEEMNKRLDKQDDKLDIIGNEITEIKTKDKNKINWLSKIITHPNFKIFAGVTISIIALILLLFGVLDPSQLKKIILWIFTGL